MQSMFRHNATSRAWEQLTELTDLSFDELQRRYGVTRLNPDSSRERLLAASGYALRFERRDEEKEISICIVNDSLPRGRVPKERIFAVEGDADNPSLSERDGREQGKVSDVLDRVIRWFRDFAGSRSG